MATKLIDERDGEKWLNYTQSDIKGTSISKRKIAGLHSVVQNRYAHPLVGLIAALALTRPKDCLVAEHGCDEAYDRSVRFIGCPGLHCKQN